MATVFVTCYCCHPRYFNYYTFIPKTKQNKKIKQTYEAILKFPRTPTLWLFWLINNNSILDFFSVSTKKEKEVTHGTWRKFATHFHQFEIFLDWVTLFIFLCPAMSENCDVPKCRFFTGLDFEIIPYRLNVKFLCMNKLWRTWSECSFVTLWMVNGENSSSFLSFIQAGKQMHSEAINHISSALNSDTDPDSSLTRENRLQNKLTT